MLQNKKKCDVGLGQLQKYLEILERVFGTNCHQATQIIRSAWLQIKKPALSGLMWLHLAKKCQEIFKLHPDGDPNLH